MTPAPAPGYDPADAEARLSGDARDLLVAAAVPGGAGAVTLVRPPAGRSCVAGGRQFMATGTLAELARWVEAAGELVRAGLARHPGPGGTDYPITPAGFDAAARLRPALMAPTADTADLARRARRSGYLARPRIGAPADQPAR